jgi:hypothetical protein
MTRAPAMTRADGIDAEVAALLARYHDSANPDHSPHVQLAVRAAVALCDMGHEDLVLQIAERLERQVAEMVAKTK